MNLVHVVPRACREEAIQPGIFMPECPIKKKGKTRLLWYILIVSAAKRRSRTTMKYGKHNLMQLMARLSKSGQRPILPVMNVVLPDGGSRFGEDVIRITGSDEFCEAVLSRLTDLLDGERADSTRLDASWSEVKGDKFVKGKGGNSIYLRLACRSRGNSPMARAHQGSRIQY